ncbi:MAG: flippase-like domain-containing protein [Rubrobacter sp.]|nr:flippase-like domain-containing protein [Rubrobacter sp.]
MLEPSRPPEKTQRENAASAPSLAQRVFRVRNIASFVLALGILYLVYRQLLGLDWGAVWASVRGADAWLFALAFAIFYCSYPVRALRWKVLLANVGYEHASGHPMPSTLGLTRIMYIAWFANCITIARLGDAYRGYLLKKTSGVSFAVTLGTILAERLLDLLVMAVMMGLGVLVIFGASLPTEATQALAAGLILSVIGIVGLLALRRLRWVFERILPKRLHAHYARLEHGIISSFGRLPVLLVYSVVGWLIEGMTLYLVALAVGVPVSVAGALVVALAASLLTTVPITPSGLGFTEAGMLVMLGWLGLDVPTASAITLLFRLINYWSIVVFGGLVLYLFSRNGDRLKKEWLDRSGTPTYENP